MGREVESFNKRIKGERKRERERERRGKIEKRGTRESE